MFNVPYSIHAAGRAGGSPGLVVASRNAELSQRRVDQIAISDATVLPGHSKKISLLIPIGPVVSRISRARQALRVKIEESTSSHTPSGAFGAGRELGELR